VRLGTLLLIIAVLAAPLLPQEHQLPWERLQPLDWQAGPALPPVETHLAAQPSSGPVKAMVTGDGSLQILSARGIIRLKTGLPGRPLRAWRDGGLPLPAASGTWLFPLDAPLSQGLGGLQWAAADFRPFLRGLLWILEDGEGFLTVV
jgi:hypothetical protein